MYHIYAGTVDTTELQSDNSLSGDKRFGWLYLAEWMTAHPDFFQTNDYIVEYYLFLFV